MKHLVQERERDGTCLVPAFSSFNFSFSRLFWMRGLIEDRTLLYSDPEVPTSEGKEGEEEESVTEAGDATELDSGTEAGDATEVEGEKE